MLYIMLCSHRKIDTINDRSHAARHRPAGDGASFAGAAHAPTHAQHRLQSGCHRSARPPRANIRAVGPSLQICRRCIYSASCAEAHQREYRCNHQCVSSIAAQATWGRILLNKHGRHNSLDHSIQLTVHSCTLRIPSPRSGRLALPRQHATERMAVAGSLRPPVAPMQADANKKTTQGRRRHGMQGQSTTRSHINGG